MSSVPEITHQLAHETRKAMQIMQQPNSLHEFLNRVRILQSTVPLEVPFLAARQWTSFRDDPVRFLLRADDETAQRIWNAVERRSGK
ncbi:MAG: hypothetical protein KGL39_44935 [Patescibacteria group bacterium]|nr:hypothetical protein [Patescibacteria group bacterium]